MADDLAWLREALAREEEARRVYPCVVIATRYSGFYEGGLWAAFHCYPEEVPEAAIGGDVECVEWWLQPTVTVAVGASPDQAVAALSHKLESGP